MPAVPKKRTSHARQGKRRRHLRVHLPTIVPCPHCRNAKLHARACPTCGYYAGREALAFTQPPPPAR